MTDVSNPIGSLICFTENVLDAPMIERLDEGCNIADEMSYLPRGGPNTFDSDNNEEVVTFNLKIGDVL